LIILFYFFVLVFNQKAELLEARIDAAKEDQKTVVRQEGKSRTYSRTLKMRKQWKKGERLPGLGQSGRQKRRESEVKAYKRSPKGEKDPVRQHREGYWRIATKYSAYKLEPKVQETGVSMVAVGGASMLDAE